VKARWLAVIAFWTAFIVAVATGAQMPFDSVWFIGFLLFALAGTVKVVRDLVRYFRNPDPAKECRFTGGYPRWFERFAVDERDQAPGRHGKLPSRR
jgi:hypothetical protein